jgi:coenzyme F420-reducing hydrogenase alpha subunit
MPERSAKGRSRKIDVEHLARVEGHGAFHVRVKDGRVTESELRLFEAPRFFEAFLVGRHFAEAPDITARICGICPVAYQMSACQALEEALGVKVDEQVRLLRRLLYCGEWIESHALHIYLLHAPDFLGYEDALLIAKDHPDAVRRGLELKKIGNDIVTRVGGREIHPINVRVGGFYRAPTRAELQALLPRLEWAITASRETVRWVSGFTFPDLEIKRDLVALRHPTEYPIHEGRLVSTGGLDIPVSEFEQHFEEIQVPHSRALHARLKRRGPYLTGPLARYTLNADRLTPLAREAAAEAGLGATCRNPFRSIVVRAVEMLLACEEALRIVEGYQPPERPAAEVVPRAGTGSGCTEAPRGILYHRYRIDHGGRILQARIVPPTSQNQSAMEDDLRDLVERSLDLDAAPLGWLCEQLVRCYDPCISCATHFLEVDIQRQ